MEKKYSKDAPFYVIYIREAHPTDGWQVRANESESILFDQPKTLFDRAEVAHTMCSKLELEIPCLLDKLDDKVGTDYSAWPDRLYVIGVDGTIAFKGRQGPQGFKPDEVAEFLEKYLPKVKKASSKDQPKPQTATESR